MKKDPLNLSKRERQIMNIVYQRGKASALEILDALPDPPSYSAVRGMLRVLGEKGLVKHSLKGKRNIYRPTVSADSAGRSAMQNLVKTFFGGSPEKAVTTLLDLSKESLSDEALDRLSQMIVEARAEEH